MLSLPYSLGMKLGQKNPKNTKISKSNGLEHSNSFRVLESRAHENLWSTPKYQDAREFFGTLKKFWSTRNVLECSRNFGVPHTRKIGKKNPNDQFAYS